MDRPHSKHPKQRPAPAPCFLAPPGRNRLLELSLIKRWAFPTKRSLGVPFGAPSRGSLQWSAWLEENDGKSNKVARGRKEGERWMGTMVTECIHGGEEGFCGEDAITHAAVRKKIALEPVDEYLAGACWSVYEGWGFRFAYSLSYTDKIKGRIHPCTVDDDAGNARHHDVVEIILRPPS